MILSGCSREKETAGDNPHCNKQLDKRILISHIPGNLPKQVEKEQLLLLLLAPFGNMS